MAWKALHSYIGPLFAPERNMMPPHAPADVTHSPRRLALVFTLAAASFAVAHAAPAHAAAVAATRRKPPAVAADPGVRAPVASVATDTASLSYPPTSYSPASYPAGMSAPALPPPDRSGPSSAAPSPGANPFALDLSAVTWIPLSVGPELSFELPGRVLAQVHLGWMPELYSHTLTDSLEDAGVYDSEISNLVDGAVRGATIWRLNAGWRPFPRAGLELTVGYAHVSLDGATNSDEVIPLVPEDVADEIAAEVGNDVDVNLDSSIHHFTVGAGWRWLIADHLVIRANVGYMQAFASHSKLDIQGRPDLTGLAAPTVESVLHDHYMRYVKLPVVGFGVGYRFF
jgi:hypothetical protein